MVEMIPRPLGDAGTTHLMISTIRCSQAIILSIIHHTIYKLWRSATIHLTPTPQIAWSSGTLPLNHYQYMGVGALSQVVVLSQSYP